MEQWEIKAYKFAQEAHKGQIDKEGKDYFLNHVVHVVDILKTAMKHNDSYNGEDYKNLVTAAYLHDVLEDCIGNYLHNAGITINDYLMRCMWGDEIIGLVWEVTKTGYNKFPNLKTLDGYLLKFADRTANLSRRKGGMNNKEIKKYMKKSVFWDTE
jgi:(p)ppGpp synthase/HD superfamily hydrolase